MKKLLLILLFPLLTAFSGGDEVESWVNDFLYFEPNLNLLYISVEGRLQVVVDGKKTRTFDLTNNVAVYDISKDSTRYIFKKGFEENINSIIYEQSFISKTNSISLNMDGEDEDEDSCAFCINNAGLTQRELSPKLIIETKSIHSGIVSLWLCNKNGTGLEKVAELKDEDYFLIDTKGRNLLVINKSDSRSHVNKIKY